MAEDALIDEAPDDRPFAAPPFIIVMVTRHDMGRLAVREIADTIDVADPLRPEIGRASCRERVCQYVYISVVAVSLKKKQILNKHTYNTTRKENITPKQS